MDENEHAQHGEVVVLIGEVLKERGITPSLLAKETGLSRPTCYKLMNGDIKRIEFLTLALLCHVLSVPVNRLLYYRPQGDVVQPVEIG